MCTQDPCEGCRVTVTLCVCRWVMLKNVHLAPGWLMQLEKKLHSLQPHACFRLFLTMEINPKVSKRCRSSGCWCLLCKRCAQSRTYLYQSQRVTGCGGTSAILELWVLGQEDCQELEVSHTCLLKIKADIIKATLSLRCQ